jgi:uncharacterized protein (TIGR00369 family)
MDDDDTRALEDADPQRGSHWREMERTYGESAIHRAFGMRLRVVQAGEAEVLCDPGGNSANRMGTVAGGVLAQMIDSAVLQAIRTQLGPQDGLVTVEMNVNFLRPAPVEQQLRATGYVLSLSPTLAVGRADVHDVDVQLLAVGLVTARVRRRSGV